MPRGKSKKTEEAGPIILAGITSDVEDAFSKVDEEQKPIQ